MSKMYKILMSAKDDIIKELKSGDIDVGALAKIMIRAFKDEVEFGTVTEEYLHKYTTKQLLDMVNKNVADGGMMLTGKLQEADVLNGNRRVYPYTVLAREVKNYQKLVSENHIVYFVKKLSIKNLDVIRREKFANT